MWILKTLGFSLDLTSSTPKFSALHSSVQREQRKRLSERRNYMTSAQISYRQLLETMKHNREQEANWQSTLSETRRHNAEQERLSQYQTDTSAATARYSADTSAATSRYTSETSAAATRYAAEQRKEGTVYSADVNKYIADQKLAWQKYTDTYRNTLSSFEYKLDKARTNSSVALNDAQIAKYAKDIQIALDNLAIQADQLGLNAERNEFLNALDRARKWESYSKTAMNAEQVSRAIVTDIQNIFGGKVKKAIDKVGDMLDKVSDLNKDQTPDVGDNEIDTLFRNNGGASNGNK